jgi:Domain of unknown function (DUF1918)
MYAIKGDRLLVQGTRAGDPLRDGEIIAVRGDDGAPPYLVRWTGDGHESLCFPGPDTTVEPSRP